MSKARLFGFLAIFLFVSCSTTVQPTARQVTDTSRLQRVVQTLAAPEMQGRGLETEGLAKARDYLASKLEKMQLVAPVNGDYLQSLDVSTGVAARQQSLELVTGPDSVQPLTPKVDFNTLGFSKSGPFEGQVVFAGYGIDAPEQRYSSFRNLSDSDGPDKPLAGKVAVVFRFEPMDADGRSIWASKGQLWSPVARLTYKAQQAANLGATAMLVVNPPSHLEGGLRSTRSTVAPAGAIPIMQISESCFRQMLTAAGRDAPLALSAYQKHANDGTTRPDTLEGFRVRGNVQLSREHHRVSNIIGLLPGHGELASQYVVVGAHYDHLGHGEFGSLAGRNNRDIHPGADDNASGVAAVLELASHLKNTTQPDKPCRSVLFTLFAAEERGLFGSRHFIERIHTDMNIEPEQIIAMINFDMVGRLTANELYVLGASSAPEFKQILRRANHGVGLSLRFDTGVLGASDHLPFHARQIPAIHFFTGVHSDYHRPSDTADKVNVKGLGRIAALATNVVQHLQARRNPLSFDESGVSVRTAFSSRVYLGIMPDYGTSDGCHVLTVSPASPAHESGLLAKDVIVQWDNQPIRSVYDLTKMLNGCRPGQTVVLGVLRGSRTIELEVTLQSR